MIQDKNLSRDVAQFGRALCSGRRGRVFKSRHPDHQSEPGRNSRSGLSFYFTVSLALAADIFSAA